LSPKPADCDFRVINLPPSGDFEEIGTLTHNDGEYGDQTPYEFKVSIRADVCRAGGDLVVTEVNGHGLYVRGTVLKQRSSPGATLAPAPTQP